VIAAVCAGLAAAVAGLIAVAGYSGGWVIGAVAALVVLGLAVGWSPLMRLPHPIGTAVLIGGSGVAGIAVALGQAEQARPLAPFAILVSVAALAAFGHELLRRDGRSGVVESITGTLSGQLVAVLAAGWVLVAGLDDGTALLAVTAAAVAGSRIDIVLPLPPRFSGWVGVGLGVLAALLASLLVDGVRPLTAAALGAGVGTVAVAFDRLLGPADRRLPPLAVLALSAAPVAAAGTVAYAAIRVTGG
jgi:hypothetical protein